MLAAAKLSCLLSEFILLILGAMLILLAVTGRVGLPSRPTAIVALAVFFLYWGARAWMRPEPRAIPLHRAIRAGSLAIVGIVMLGIAFGPARYSETLLEFAGAMLVLRGILGSVLLVRQT
jgi:hypothetical protein